MAALGTAAVVGIAVLLAGLVVIWSAWQARWIVGGTLLVAAETLHLLVVRMIAGPNPLVHGLILGVAMFLGSALIVMGAIAWTIFKLAAREEQRAGTPARRAEACARRSAG